MEIISKARIQRATMKLADLMRIIRMEAPNYEITRAHQAWYRLKTKIRTAIGRDAWNILMDQIGADAGLEPEGKYSIWSFRES